MVLVAVVFATVVYPLDMKARFRRKREARALGALRSIANAQTLYREGDKDGDGVLDFAGALSALVATGPGGNEDLIRSDLASGFYAGYVFDLRRAPGEAGQFVWFASASPLDPSEGDRCFGINMTGVLQVSSEEPIRFDEADGSPLNGSLLSE